LLAVAAPLYVIFVTLRTPYHHEWIEGAALSSLRSLLHGESLYQPPSPEYVSFLYTPLYYYLALPFARLFGASLPLLRLVSLACTLGTFAVLGRLAWRATGARWPAVAAIGCFALGYKMTGEWFDQPRDPTFLLFMLLAVERLQAGRSRGHLLLAGVFAFLAVYTKQTGAAFALLIAVYLVWRHRRRASWYLAPLAGLALAAFASEQLWSGGWFAKYCLRLMWGHSLLRHQLVAFWTYQLANAPVIVVLAAIGVLGSRKRRTVADEVLVVGAIAFVAISWSSLLHQGGYLNTLLPMQAGVSLFGALGLARLEGLLSVAPLTRGRLLLAHGVVLLLLLQFVRLAYDPRRELPDPAAAVSAHAKVLTLASGARGAVWMPPFGDLVEEASGTPQAHLMAVEDVWRSGGSLWPPLHESLLSWLEQNRVQGVLLFADTRWTLFAMMPELRQLFPHEEVFLTSYPLLTGASQDSRLLLRTRAAPDADSAVRAHPVEAVSVRAEGGIE
jgi:hypothetical protein